MTEPALASQFLGLATTMICLFIALLLIANSEQKAKAKKKAQEEHDNMIILQKTNKGKLLRRLLMR